MDQFAPAIVLVGIGGYGVLYVDEILKDTDSGLCTFVGAVDPAAQASPRYETLCARGVPIYDTLEAFFAAHTADICCIAAPIQYHTAYSLTALKYGCHVLCEKPLSGDWRDGLLLDAVADREYKFVISGYQWSHSAAILALKRDIMDGRFGAPKHLKTRILWPRATSYFKRGSGWAGKRYAADGTPILDSVANNAAAHYLHNMLFVLGGCIDRAAMPVSVDAELLRVNPIENFDSCVLRMKLENGADALFVASHSTKEVSNPIFTYEFEHGYVTYAQEDKTGIVAVFDDGTTKNYGDPFADQMNKVRYAITACDQNHYDRGLPCTAMTAVPHARTIAAISEAPIVDVPDAMKEQIMVGAKGDDPQYIVRGLKDALCACYERGCMLSELDDAESAPLRAILKPVKDLPMPEGEMDEEAYRAFIADAPKAAASSQK
ncbi:MAG: Gfo/Idh/MocA family oxidoreductase [Clostridia bacterium]|nr:Gfo/Idh/MocA family oxidoreductase [Clostridia bacterium]